MALMPKRIRHRKAQRGRVRGRATRGNRVAFGDFGLQSLEPGWITARQIEAGRVSATHFLHREGRVYKPGTVLFEIGGTEEDTAKAALRRVAAKMPVRCRLVARAHGFAR